MHKSHSTSPHRRSIGGGAAWKKGSASFRHSSSNTDSWTGGGGGPAAVNLTDKQYLNIVQSMGQSVHVLDHNYRIIYWNRSAENLYGYSCEEALGQDLVKLLTEPQDHAAAYEILHRVLMGENWTGQFPVIRKGRSKLLIVATNTPLYDDNGNLVGGICVSADSTLFRQAKALMLDLEDDSYKLGRVHHQWKGLSEVIEPETKPEEENLVREGDFDNNGGAGRPRGDTYHSDPFGVFSGDFQEENPWSSETKPGIWRNVRSKVESLMGKKSLSWAETKSFKPWSQNQPENEAAETNKTTHYEASGDWSSSMKVNSSSHACSCSSTSSRPVIAINMDSNSLDYEILWEELTMAEQIGQGSCGTVYHALWHGSDVAVKLLSRQEYSDEVISSFKQEVSLMKRLRHPNILLFMGAVTSPQRLCIVTEFLPRGSLFRLLHKSKAKLEKRRLIHMALDIARGMNHLHHYNPPIIHLDLKSSNLLVDKNWTVKVCDFGLSRLKYESYLTTKTGKGTPQWMAPEVLRSEPSNEKADVYSYGVILWELVTHKIPWENLDPIQVIGAVGVMNQRLDIPDDVEPQWASLIESCFHSEPASRPSFQELVDQLKDMQKQHATQLRAGRAAQKEV